VLSFSSLEAIVRLLPSWTKMPPPVPLKSRIMPITAVCFAVLPLIALPVTSIVVAVPKIPPPLAPRSTPPSAFAKEKTSARFCVTLLSVSVRLPPAA
jgi:hypothetical protein